MTRHYRTAALIIFMVAASLILVKIVEDPSPLALCTPAAGVLTFFHFYAAPPDGISDYSKEGRLRAAIAGAVIVQYLVIVGIVAYFIKGAEVLPKVTETMLTSFTTITGIVVAFYFGASAYVESKRQGREPPVEGAEAKKTDA